MLDSVGQLSEASAVEETVRRDIQHTHHCRPWEPLLEGRPRSAHAAERSAAFVRESAQNADR